MFGSVCRANETKLDKLFEGQHIKVCIRYRFKFELKFDFFFSNLIKIELRQLDIRLNLICLPPNSCLHLGLNVINTMKQRGITLAIYGSIQSIYNILYIIKLKPKGLTIRRNIL